MDEDRRPKLSKLIEALNIFLKYGDKVFPTHCANEMLMVAVPPSAVSLEDKAKLDHLGFHFDEEEEFDEDDDGRFFMSRAYGSC